MPAAGIYRSPTLRIDLDGKLVERDGERLRLTTLEARVLRHLAERMDQPVTMETLLRDVWGYRDGVVTKAVYESLRRLRRKIERDSENPLHLLTEWGTGYRLRGLEPEANVVPSGLHGRDELLAQVEERLLRTRLLTLTGPGGAGKTRVARRIAEGRPSVWCELEGCRTGVELGAAVAGALGIQGAGEVVEALRSRTGLLVLDNFEQLVDEAPTLARWLRAAPQLRVLVTSRRALHLDEEQIVPVAPLGAPAAPTADHPAVALLLARVAAVAPERPIGPEEIAAATHIARAVDGLPLALEIVAARARLGTLQDLAARVDTSIFHLPAVRRDLPARHASLEATLTWSWLLLSDRARGALTQLVVFEGSVSLDAAEAVLDVPGSALLALDELVDANLLASHQGRLVPYVGVRELVRDKEGSRLDPGGQAAARERLFRWVLRLPEDRRPAELDNLAGAVRQADRHADPELAGRVAVVWIQTLLAARPVDIAVAALEPRLGRPGVTDHERLELRLVAASAAQLQGAVGRARVWLEQAMPAAERLGVPSMGRVRLLEGVLLHDEKDLAAAERTYRDALAMIDAEAAPQDAFRGHLTLGYALLESGRADEAQAAFGEALERAHRLGAVAPVAAALLARGLLELGRARPEAAVGRLEQVRAIARRAGAEAVEAMASTNLGFALTELGRPAEARAHLDAAIAAHRRLRRHRHLLLSLVYRGRAEHDAGAADQALATFAEALALSEEVVAPEGEGAARVGRGRILLERGDPEGEAEIRRGAALLRAAGDEAAARRAEAGLDG